jgi:putative transposase
MPRTARLDLPGIAQHVIQRGNDRQPCFFQDSDRLLYLHELQEQSQRFGCRLHAYVLMDNHVHLLVTPLEAGAVGRMMQAIGRRYVRYVNDRLARSGTLWEGRYKACLVGDDRYALACYRYIELNPVRAAMVAAPGDYPWSSHRSNVSEAEGSWLQAHPAYLALASEQAWRHQRYRALFAAAPDMQEIDGIRLYTQRQRAWGSEAFQRGIER